MSEPFLIHSSQLCLPDASHGSYSAEEKGEAGSGQAKVAATGGAPIGIITGVERIGKD